MKKLELFRNYQFNKLINVCTYFSIHYFCSYVKVNFFDEEFSLISSNIYFSLSDFTHLVISNREKLLNLEFHLDNISDISDYDLSFYIL